MRPSVALALSVLSVAQVGCMIRTEARHKRRSWATLGKGRGGEASGPCYAHRYGSGGGWDKSGVLNREGRPHPAV